MYAMYGPSLGRRHVLSRHDSVVGFLACGSAWFEHKPKTTRETKKRNGNVECPLFLSPSFQSLGLFHWVLVVRVKFNRSDVTDARSHSSDINPALPQLIPPGTLGIVPGINRLTGRQQGEMSVARAAVIGEGIQSRISRQVAGE